MPAAVLAYLALPLVSLFCLAAGARAEQESADRAASKLFTCPPTTYARFNPHGEHMHCICPEPLICEGCEEGCELLDLGMKSRCVRGFRPSCHTCRCSEGACRAVASPHICLTLPPLHAARSTDCTLLPLSRFRPP